MKNLPVVGLVFLFLIVGLCGCQEREETPNIEFIQENGMLMVDFVEISNLSWDNINITISSGNYSDIGFHSNPYTAIRKFYDNGPSCPNDWGVIEEDNGIFLQPIKGIVTLYWIPTNETLGEWDFTKA